MTMRGRASAPYWFGRTLGVAFVALSLVHTPLPEPDFHKIRHQDGRGEVCEHHDHLLRWHPDAVSTRDVAVLHWHWFLPGPAGSAPPSGKDGTAIHAHAPVWQAGLWDDGPRVSPDSTSRPVERPLPSPLDGLLTPPYLTSLGHSGYVPRPPAGFDAPTARGASVMALLQRWTC